MKIFIYCHDTFGLGHLRRARTIANHIVAENSSAEILIVSGLPFGDAFTYLDRVQVVQILPLRQQIDGSYLPFKSTANINEIIKGRSKAVLENYCSFEPDLVIVDGKKPLGLHREMLDVLSAHKNHGGKSVLGMRDVMDEPEFVKAEWESKGILDYVNALYDEIWIYGPASFYNPLADIALSPILARQVFYTGFLEREIIQSPAEQISEPPERDNVLVTSGGGGDGFDLTKYSIKAAQTEFGKKQNFLLALGAFMPDEEKQKIHAISDHLTNISVVDFRSDLDVLLRNAKLVVGMCGYNTFCEVLSFNKRAIFVPRVKPRPEQEIRAKRASAMGWSTTLSFREAADADGFSNAMEKAMKTSLPKDAVLAPDLGGLERIDGRIKTLFGSTNG